MTAIAMTEGDVDQRTAVPLVNRSVDSIVAVPGRVTSRLLFPLLRTWHNAAFGEFSVDQRSLLQPTTVMLTESQITKYQQDGYVTPDFRLPEDILEDIRLAHRRLVERHPEFSDYCSALLAYDTWYLTIARIPEILDMVAQVIGDDIALWNSSFFAKPARVGTKTPWHQDGEYWPIAPLATCTVWIAIDASTPENGCLRVIPGSHREQRLAQHSKNDAVGLALNLELNKAEFSEEDAEDIVLEPGQVSLHDVYLYHGSEANVSDRPRRGMTLRYMPTTSVYEHEQPTRFAREGRLVMSQRTVFLMRGIDQSGQNDFRVRY